MEMKITVTDNAGKRIDAYLAMVYPEHSRSYFAHLIDEKHVFCNGKIVKSSYKVESGDEIVVEVPQSIEDETLAEDIPLDIVYEDAEMLVINKPRGMVVHPANGHPSGTLVNALLSHCTDLSGINGVKRPGIVHRIDKDTSGLLVVAKNDDAHRFLSDQLSDHTMYREYYALVYGTFEESSGRIIAPIGRDSTDRKKMAVDLKHGKPAVTHFRVVERFHQFTLLSLRLETGRTHQIRVHLSYIKHPIVGDETYGRRKETLYLKGQLLQAYRIAFIHPKTKKEMSFEIPMEEDLKAMLERLRKEEEDTK